jgi:hypothetical protein
VPGIHVFLLEAKTFLKKTWMAGTSPAMTEPECYVVVHTLFGTASAPYENA